MAGLRLAGLVVALLARLRSLFFIRSSTPTLFVFQSTNSHGRIRSRWRDFIRSRAPSYVSNLVILSPPFLFGTPPASPKLSPLAFFVLERDLTPRFRAVSSAILETIRPSSARNKKEEIRVQNYEGDV